MNDDATPNESQHHWTALHIAAKCGNVAHIRELLISGADPNITAANGWTPLFLAAGSRNVDAVKVLIENGANINATTSGGWSALHWAAKNGSVAIVQELINSGADANIADQAWGCKPINLARANGHHELIAVLKNAMKIKNNER